jgi:hypothetical protein
MRAYNLFMKQSFAGYAISFRVERCSLAAVWASASKPPFCAEPLQALYRRRPDLLIKLIENRVAV